MASREHQRLFDDGDSALIPEMYDRLRAAARLHFQRQAPGQTLQPTALVHEAFIKLATHDDVTWENRAHFLALASKAMRQILIDAARSRSRQKRGGEWSRVELHDADKAEPPLCIDLLALNEALEELEKLNADQARIVEMHFLGGMKFEEIAAALEMPLRDARNEWYMARAFLQRRVQKGDRP